MIDPKTTFTRKALIFEANLCPDRQWDDYKEAVCPLLGEFGCLEVATSSKAKLNHCNLSLHP
jgi:hypothetical protein